MVLWSTLGTGALAASGNGLPLLLAQICVIVALARLVGWLFVRLGQPMVIGEIVAGLLLGPSCFGLLAPGLSATLFPAAAMAPLNSLAQIGLIFFMFLVGLEINIAQVRAQSRVAVAISFTGIVVPFALGVLLALPLHQSYAPVGVGPLPFALFCGAALSVTAFPVLARILAERRLTDTPLGGLALTCAAVDDLAAWCLLAAVISIVRSGTLLGALPSVLLAVCYCALMLTAGRWLLGRLVRAGAGGGRSLFVILCVGALCSAMLTELIGIHTIFGAFLFGAIVPRHALLVRPLVEKIEDFVVVLLLPLFFAYTGLRTEVGLLNTPAAWAVCAVIILVATLGKFGGTSVAGRLSGMPWREAAAIGVLMNTRGLMELIILNVGLDLGVLSPALFTMMVIMALVTTGVTTPLLQRIMPAERWAVPGRGPVAVPRAEPTAN